MPTDTLEGQLARRVLAAATEYQRLAGAQRTSWGMRHNQSNGRRMSKIPPYGSCDDPAVEGRMLPCVEEQANIQKILAWSAEGLGSLRIKRRLERAGIQCRGRESWNKKTIEAIIRRAKGAA